MTKRILSLCLCLLLVLGMGAPLRASAEEAEIANQLQLLDLLAEKKAAEADAAEFTCSPAFYRELKANDFTLLQRLCLLAGLERQYISYSDSARRIQLSIIHYTDVPLVECATEDAVRAAVLDFAAQGVTDYRLLCTPELCQQLYTSGRLANYAARGGAVGYFYPRYYTELGLITLSNTEYTDKPVAYVEDYAQFSTAIAGFEAQGCENFYVVFSPELYHKISRSSERKIMEWGSSLAGYGAMSQDGSCHIHYYSVEYTDMARMICQSEEDVVESIRQVGAAGIADFQLVFPNKWLYEKLAADDFALLIQLQTQAGMSGGDMAYSWSGDIIQYTDAVIVSDVVPLSSVEQARAYVEEQVAAGAEDITLFCSQELYNALLGDLTERFSIFHSGMNRIYDLLSQAGIDEYSLSSMGGAGVITVHVERLFPGTAIVLAVRSGDSSGLSQRELETWEAAAQVAEAARNADPLETARYIHDWLCEHNVYVTDESTDEDDNAIGAILNGEANCDGYTDAFYLIGTLAGLNVRYQHGDSIEKGMPSFTPVTHIWNLLELDGQWRMVDVTWDDGEEEGWSYIWFNVGLDLASRMHTWNEDMTVPLAADTQRQIVGDNEFYVSSEAELKAALSQAAAGQMSSFYILFLDPSLAPLHEEALDSMSRKASGMFRYSWQERMCLLSFSGVDW